jgi:alpha-glucosidase (family GH31 glycosyl hydrolase)
MKRVSLFFTFIFLLGISYAQITTLPSKPLSDENIEIIFDAGKGNKALYGLNEDIYFHAGLITATSNSSSDWKFVWGDWGKAKKEYLLEDLGGDKYKMNINIRKDFGIDSDVQIYQLALVFRDAKGEKVAKTQNESDFLIPVDGYVPPKKEVDSLKYDKREYVKHRLNGQVLELTTSHGDYHFQFYNDHILKVKFLANNQCVKDTSISVILNPDHQRAKLLDFKSNLSWKNGDFLLKIDKAPLLISYYFKNKLLFQEELGFFERNSSIGLRTYLAKDEAIYGTGERAVPMNRRGYKLELFNQPDYNYGLNARNLNYTLPVMLSSKNYLLFIDNPQKAWLDIGETRDSILEFRAIGGEMKYFVVTGNNFSEIQTAFTELVGRQPLPPRWALGNLQSRMAYRTQSELEGIVEEMQKKDFPLDAVIIDFYWFGDSIKGYLGQLDWYRKNWPEPEKMIQKFKDKGVKTILITEPFVIDTSYWFRHGDTSGLFATDKAGGTYVMKDFYFGHAALMDMFKPATKKWFWQQYDKQMKIGVEGWWGDLGEPETHPEDMYHVNGKAFEVHNMYAHEWARMVSDGFKEFYPNKRLFHLNRSGATGTQRYSIFPWSGDVGRSWSGFQAQLPLMLNMSLCGLGYISSDLGGFAMGEKDEELYIRWLQMGVFNPVFRPHGSGIPSEPIFFSQETQRIVREAIKLRYRLMPYIYNLAYQNTTQGTPIVKPLLYYHQDEKFKNYSDAYYFGRQIIAAPVIEKAQKEKEVWLPEGLWYDFYTNDTYNGNNEVLMDLTLDHFPVFVKSGAFIPMLNDYNTTDNYPQDVLRMHYYPAEINASSSYQLYEDDGVYANNLEEGLYQITAFSSSNTDEKMNISFERVEGAYLDGIERRLQFIIHHLEDFPEAVTLNGESIMVYHVLQMPAVKVIDAKYDPKEMKLYINMPWNPQSKNILEIIK